MRLFAIGIRRLYLGLRYGDWHPAPAGHYVKRGKHLVFVSDSRLELFELGQFVEQQFVEQQLFGF